MKALGRISMQHAGSPQRARRKIMQVVRRLGCTDVEATRLATAVSFIGRELEGVPNSAVEVALDADAAPVLVLTFDGAGGCPPRAEGFFDTTEDVGERWVGRRLLVGAVVDERALEECENTITRKSRTELAQTVTQRNVELQESQANLSRTTSAKERMEGELSIGAEIQMAMLPLDFPAFPGRNDFDIYALLRPAREVGGDFYDFFLVDENTLCFCIGDVSGKGVPSALFMAVSKTLIKSRATNDPSPASILTHVNDELAERNESAMFVTLFLALLDLRTGHLVYSNAGHNPPYQLREGQPPTRLDRRHGPVAGALDDIVFGEDELTLVPGDTLFLYTDGVNEAMSPTGELYSEKRMVDRLANQEDIGVNAVVMTTADGVWEFQSTAEQADDVTILAVRWQGVAAGEQTESLHLTLANDFAEIDRLNAAFNAFAEQHGVQVKLCRKVNLVFDDLLNNVISYAFAEGGSREVEVSIELSRSRLSLTISDDGIPFNPFGLNPPNTELGIEERDIGGLGIHLIRNLMDEFEYSRRTNLNVVRLAKHLQPSDFLETS